MISSRDATLAGTVTPAPSASPTNGAVSNTPVTDTFGVPPATVTPLNEPAGAFTQPVRPSGAPATRHCTDAAGKAVASLAGPTPSSHTVSVVVTRFAGFDKLGIVASSSVVNVNEATGPMNPVVRLRVFTSTRYWVSFANAVVSCR